ASPSRRAARDTLPPVARSTEASCSAGPSAGRSASGAAAPSQAAAAARPPPPARAPAARGAERAALREKQRALERVHELPPVAGPGVARERREEVRRHGGRRDAEAHRP